MLERIAKDPTVGFFQLCPHVVIEAFNICRDGDVAVLLGFFGIVGINVDPGVMTFGIDLAIGLREVTEHATNLNDSACFIGHQGQ
jgi:hypothetical protein